MEEYRTPLSGVITYIEAHLRDDKPGVLDNRTLSQLAGYSEFHFLRIFRKIIGLTPADYIRKRRLTEIVHAIGDPHSGSISDTAFSYGFNSKENFTRAFKNEHHILPTEFRSVKCSLRLYEAYSFDRDFRQPQVSLGFSEPFSLTVYQSDEAFPPHFWNRYNAEGRSLKLSGGQITEDYGAMRWNPEKHGLDYYIGIRTDEVRGDARGTEQLAIAGGLYAMFDTAPATQYDFVETIRKTWDWIYQIWLPKNGYRRRCGYELEGYTEASRKYTERIYVPIEKITPDHTGEK
ncbi:MAG: helix-turn-helix domain-containing protein [Eubacteriales bacterium]